MHQFSLNVGSVEIELSVFQVFPVSSALLLTIETGGEQKRVRFFVEHFLENDESDSTTLTVFPHWSRNCYYDVPVFGGG